MATKRMDKDRKVLRKGEQQRKNGTYGYRWTDNEGKRHSTYAKTLEELREKEKQIEKDMTDGIKSETACVTLNQMFILWCDIKRGLKDNTFQNYKYMYNQFVAPNFGKKRISTIKKTDVRKFYNMLVDERGLKVNTLDCIHNVLHQVLDMAVDDNYIRVNPSDKALKELKKVKGRKKSEAKSLSMEEQELFLKFLKNHKQYAHWYPIFAVMLGSGLRVGEVTGLRWCDVDFEEETINVNHTLVYYNHAENGCYFNVNTPKTENSSRTIPMLGSVKDALLLEKKFQEETGIGCKVNVNCYTDFIFVNRFGNVQHQGTLNKALKRIIRDCNYEVLEKEQENPVLLPVFSCHSLRHTFGTRLCEKGVNVKVIQSLLGHADISTTLDIYTDVLEDFKKQELKRFENREEIKQMWVV